MWASPASRAAPASASLRAPGLSAPSVFLGACSGGTRREFFQYLAWGGGAGGCWPLGAGRVERTRQEATVRGALPSIPARCARRRRTSVVQFLRDGTRTEPAPCCLPLEGLGSACWRADFHLAWASRASRRHCGTHGLAPPPAPPPVPCGHVARPGAATTRPASPLAEGVLPFPSVPASVFVGGSAHLIPPLSV